jgi:MFS family permease
VSESSGAVRTPDHDDEAAPERREGSFLRRLAAAVVITGLTVLALLAGAAFVPRWWAHRIGDQVDGSMASGIGLGLFYGFVFTLLALLVLWFALRRRRSARGYLIGACIALLLATPNLLTLGIVLGSGNAAHAGDRTLDVEAPGFRWSVLFGAVGAALAAVALLSLLRSRRRARERERDLREQLAEARREREEPTPSA